MGNYTPLAALGHQTRARSQRQRVAQARDIERTEAPYACPSCYDTSVVPMDCPACEERMIRFQEAVVLPGEPKPLAWWGWPIVGLSSVALLSFAPWLLANVSVDASYAAPVNSGAQIASPGGVWVGVVLIALVFVSLALWGYRRKTAPRRKARDVAHRLRRHAVALSGEAPLSTTLRIRGVARVRVAEGARQLYVQDDAGQVRVHVDASLTAFGPHGPLRAIADGDSVEILGELEEEAGEPSTYRARERSPVFRAGAIVLVGD